GLPRRIDHGSQLTRPGRKREPSSFQPRSFLQVIGEPLKVVNGRPEHSGQFRIEQQFAVLRLPPRKLHHHLDGGEWCADLVREGPHGLPTVQFRIVAFLRRLHNHAHQPTVVANFSAHNRRIPRGLPEGRSPMAVSGMIAVSASLRRNFAIAPLACSSAWYELRTSGPASTWRKPIAFAADLNSSN